MERGSFIVAVDVATGKERWRFNTVARPGEPGGDTWNDLPLDKRSGGSVWNPGSYDPELNLLYFGTAPTYDTRPLRARLVKPGVQAIFEALDAATGEYLFSIDIDMQNVITAIDPKTGEKTTNPASIPDPEYTRLSLSGICPDTLGARNRMATAYNARSRLLYVPMTDTCVDPTPTT